MRPAPGIVRDPPRPALCLGPDQTLDPPSPARPSPKTFPTTAELYYTRSRIVRRGVSFPGGTGAMGEVMIDEVRRAVDEVYRSDSRRVFATLVRLLGDFDLAEEAMHEAFAAAIVQWPRDGVPANPRAWL